MKTQIEISKYIDSQLWYTEFIRELSHLFDCRKCSDYLVGRYERETFDFLSDDINWMRRRKEFLLWYDSETDDFDVALLDRSAVECVKYMEQQGYYKQFCEELSVMMNDEHNASYIRRIKGHALQHTLMAVKDLSLEWHKRNHDFIKWYYSL